MDKTIWSTAAITEYRATDVEGVGRLRCIGGKIYKWVYNGTGAAFVVGNVLFGNLTTPAAGDLDGQNVYVAATANLGLMEGVAVSAVPTAYYGWIQVYGYNASINTEGTADIGAGDSLKGVNGQSYVVLGAALGTAPLYRRQIVALEAYTTNSAALKKGFIHCL